MENLVQFSYQGTGESVKWNDCGMREMQQRVFSARNNQYLLAKAPPASGKSRAMMFIGLDKIHNQNIKKVIVAVPETSIGGSFSDTDLMSAGFFADWNVEEEYNLCSTEFNDGSKVAKFIEFMSSDAEVVICSHSTFRNAFNRLSPEDFNDCLVGIDEFHHVSSQEGNVLGAALQKIMDESTAHIFAMTGSYFRGDTEEILAAKYEEKFKKVTYNYYEQLNGYKYLKSLGIGHHFYRGSYLDEIQHLLHPEKKTIIHIPNVNGRESTGDKHGEVKAIINKVGHIAAICQSTQMITVRLHKPDNLGRTEIKVANLVNEDRRRLQGFLRDVKIDDVDWIIALGTAKEGFDWEYCEYALTVGVRRSVTEIVQIIGRCTRDSSNKTHAQFVNLIQDPLYSPEETEAEVNDMLKVITCCLLMEDVFEQPFKFELPPRDSKTDVDDEDNEPKVKKNRDGSASIPMELPEAKTERVKSILEEDIGDLIQSLYSERETEYAQYGSIDADYYNKSFIPSVIAKKYPELDEDEINVIAAHTIANIAIKPHKNESGKVDTKHVNVLGVKTRVSDLDINLIKSKNIFEGRGAFDVLSKDINENLLYKIKNYVTGRKITMTNEEFLTIIAKVPKWCNDNGKKPSLNSEFEQVRRMAQALAFAEANRGIAHELK